MNQAPPHHPTSAGRRSGHLACLALLAALTACGADPQDGGRAPGGGQAHRIDSKPPTRAADFEHVILISLDTLRADHCSLYGYEKPTTPFLEELAERGVVFENHMVSANNTLMSHASLMTGLFPMAHDAWDKGERKQALAPPFRTLAEIFAEAGFETGSFTTNKTWLGSEFGVMQGFDHVQAEWEDNITCWTRYLEWFDERQPERSFVFLHFFDPHSESDNEGGILPYDSTEALIEQFAPPRPEGFTGCVGGISDNCTSEYLNAINAGVEPLPPDHLEFLIGLYDAGIRKMDDDLRLLFAELERRGILDRALIVITSDHGEEFMEHGKLLHGGLSDAIMHVPLMFVFPESFGIGPVRHDGVTRSVDIAPTVLDLLGLMAIGQGVTLRGPILEGTPVVEEDVFVGPAILRSTDEQGLFKIVADPKKPAFYDLDADPDEQVNLALEPGFVDSERYLAAAARVAELRRVATKIRVNFKKGEDFPPVFADDEAARLAAEQLEALGYVDMGGDE